MKQHKHTIMTKALAILLFLSFTISSMAQNVGIGTTTPAASAELDVSSTNKGFLPPRMTSAQRSAISSPAEGLLVYQIDGSKGYYYFIDGVWTSLTDEKTYTSLNICTQQWMDKNLDVTTYRNGDLIPYVTDPTAWKTLTTGAWCYYNNDPSTNATYGKLYNWYAVNDSRGLAPAGWHVPSNEEWTTLATCLGGLSVAGFKMKVSGTKNWLSPNAADNSSGWAGLPGGDRSEAGAFSGTGFTGVWWSSSESITTSAWSYWLVSNTSNVDVITKDKKRGYSVRCLRD